MLSARHLSFERQGKKIFSDISLDLKAGEITALVGPSGCGKTSLLNILSGACAPTTGEIHCTLPRPGKDLGNMRQDHGLLPWLNAQDNIALGFKLCPEQRPMDPAWLEELYTCAEIRPFLTAFPGELSGGERQRLAFLRTLALKPRLLLLDEPFAHLDACLALKLGAFLQLYVRREKAALLIVTHALMETLNIADRLLIMEGKPSRILATYNLAEKEPNNTRGQTYAEILNRLQTSERVAA